MNRFFTSCLLAFTVATFPAVNPSQAEPIDIFYLHGVLNNNPREFTSNITKFHTTITSKQLQVLGHTVQDGIPVYWGDLPFQQNIGHDVNKSYPENTQYEHMYNNVFQTNNQYNVIKSDSLWTFPVEIFAPFLQQGSPVITRKARVGLHDFSFDQMWMLQGNWDSFERQLKPSLTRQFNSQNISDPTKQRPFLIFAHSGGSMAITKYLAELNKQCPTGTESGCNPYFERNFRGLVTFGSPVDTFNTTDEIDSAATFIQRKKSNLDQYYRAK